jgi:hypothetical protein
MNERIKELAIEAELYAWAEYEKWTPTDDFSGIPHIRHICNEKFAELIIAECASLCEARAWGMIEKGFPGHEAVEECSDIIKQHFGVEE